MHELLLGCMHPHMIPWHPQVVKQPLNRDPATTWSNGYEYEYEPAQHIVPQLEREQPLRTNSAYW